MLEIKIPDLPTSPSLITLNSLCGRKAPCFHAQIVSPILRMKSAVFLSAAADPRCFWSSTSFGLVRRLEDGGLNSSNLLYG